MSGEERTAPWKESRITPECTNNAFGLQAFGFQPEGFWVQGWGFRV
jgi:hypothetical protein